MLKKSSGIPHIVVGTILLLVGGYLAYSFYYYDTGIMITTLWRDVIIFSLISVLGLIILIFGTRKTLKKL